MPFVGGKSAARDNLGGLTRIASQGALVAGGIPTTRSIVRSVVAAGGNAADVRGPTRRPTFTPPPPVRRAIIPRDRTPAPTGPTAVVSYQNSQTGVQTNAPIAGEIYGVPRVAMRRGFRSLSGDERAVVARHIVRNTDTPAAVDEVLTLGDDDLAGLSLKGIVNSVKKAVTDTGHAVGKAVTSKVGQGIIGTGLALTGVGIPAAIAIGATSKAAGELIAPGGNLGKAAHGAVTGAATGAVAGVAGKVLSARAPGLVDKSQQVVNKLSGGKLFKTAGMAGKTAAGVAAQTAGKIAGVAAAGGGAVIATGMEVFKPTLTPQGIQIEGPKVAELPPMQRQIVVPPTPADRNDRNRPFTKKRVAETTIAAGQQAKQAADSGADKLDALNAKIASLEGALGKASQAGDALGADKISQMIADAQRAVGQVSSTVGAGSDTLRTAGNAAEGAAAGAVAGAGVSGISQWIQENKALAIGGGLLAVGTVVAIMSGRSSGQSAPRRPSYRRRVA